MKIFKRHQLYSSSVVLILVVMISLLVSCGKGKDNQGDSDEYFSFDKSKLGIEIVDQELGIKFYPPIKWELRQTSISKKIESRGAAAKPGDNFVYKPTYVFFNDSTGGLLSVGKVVTNDTVLALSAQLNYYKGLIGTRHKNNNLSTENFVHSKIYFTQFKIEKQNLVSFKIVFENSRREIIQFDYTIPANNLEDTQSIIKSSLGSIRLL